jgi:hypothetical protein
VVGLASRGDDASLRIDRNEDFAAKHRHAMEFLVEAHRRDAMLAAVESRKHELVHVGAIDEPGPLLDQGNGRLDRRVRGGDPGGAKAERRRRRCRAGIDEGRQHN